MTANIANISGSDVRYDAPDLVLTEAEANAIADIYYPANPMGIGTPYVDLVTGKIIGYRKAETIYRDPFGRGVWLVIGRGHWVPARARTPVGVAP